jgi:hypothetical protein
MSEEKIKEEAVNYWKSHPLGVSEWKEYGKIFGYWHYFERRHIEELESKFNVFLKDYSEDRPIPPAKIRQFLTSLRTNINNPK